MSKFKAVSIWNVASFYDAQEQVKKMSFSDASAGTILSRSLEHINKTVYTQKGVNETFLSVGIPIDNQGGYADFIKSLKRRQEGDFKKSGTADKTKGTITLSGESTQIGVQGLEASSYWSYIEMEQANIEGGDKASDLITAHNSKYMSAIDDIGFTGIDGVGGITNHADLITSTASAVWTGMTNVELTDEFDSLILNQRLGQPIEFWCDTLVLPTPLLLKIKSANANDNYTETIEAKLMKAYNVRFVASDKLSGAGTGGTDIVLALSTSSEAIAFRIPVPLKISKIFQTSEFDYSFKSLFRIAGIDILEKVHYKLDAF